ncbi:CLUMA_CG020657, isoform A [Clunio marinus]|uniref:CLUMA_CG020657, isoform A n=1 Tax=Clunio marinus TaxID=568069 RepID=A0A1J1J5N4_9DIPT|nr:CLUMA_CG020657, isoform A [Clunio marinus]
MWNVLDFVLIVITVSTVQSASVESMENTFNCYADYLKRHGLLEPSLQFEPFNGESFLCETVLSATVEGVYSGLYDEFSKREDLKDAAMCIVNTLKELKWSDLDIKEQIYLISDGLTGEEKDMKIQELKKVQARISGNAIVSCLADKEFSELFNQIYAKDDQEDDVSDYCARKYAIESNLIDRNVYHISLNPKNISVNGIECDIINKQHFDDAEEELRQHLLRDFKEDRQKVDCLIKKYHENRYFDKTLSIALLSELDITEQQKEVERKRFIENMTVITKNLAEC